MSLEKVIDIRNLVLEFETDYDTLRILNGIDFYIGKGETLGIVGESGSGKSVTAQAIMGLLNSPPAVIKGEIEFDGKNLLKLSQEEMQDIRGNRISMIFQEPMTSLNPVFTIGNQLSEVFRSHQGMNKQEAHQSAIEALKKVNISSPEKRVRQYPYQLSGGLRQRVMIAMALACRPELLIADEPTTALDVTIQAQVLDLMRHLKEEIHTSIAFITHDLGVVSEMCSRVLVFYCGEIMEEVSTEVLFKNPKHPYTQGLLNSLPQIGKKGRLQTIPGSVPAVRDFPTGCVFYSRCAHCMEICKEKKPPFVTVGENHKARCFLYTEEVSS